MTTNNSWNSSFPAAVAQGGTGNATATAYAVQCGGTTSTGNHQSIASVGTSGQVLTSNGAGALPTFQTASSFAPNSTLQIFDDFLPAIINANTTTLGQLGWNSLGSGFLQTASISTNPGLIQSGAGGSAAAVYLGSTPNNPFILGGGAITANFVIKLTALSNSSNRYNLYVGLTDTLASSVQPVNGCYFAYSDNVNSGDWVGTTSKASARTTANSAVAATSASYVNLGITINAAASSVGFYVNGTQIANSPLAADIPTVAIGPAVILTLGAGTIPSIIVDLFYMTQTFTTPR